MRSGLFWTWRQNWGCKRFFFYYENVLGDLYESNVTFQSTLVFKSDWNQSICWSNVYECNLLTLRLWLQKKKKIPHRMFYLLPTQACRHWTTRVLYLRGGLSSGENLYMRDSIRNKVTSYFMTLTYISWTDFLRKFIYLVPWSYCHDIPSLIFSVRSFNSDYKMW